MTMTTTTMSTTARRPAALLALIVVQLFQAVGALGGGAALVASPRGGVIKLPLSYLSGSPFSDYLIPGVVLFLVLGIGPLMVAWALIRRPRSAALEAANPFRHEYWGWTPSGVIGVGLVIWIAVGATDHPLQLLAAPLRRRRHRHHPADARAVGARLLPPVATSRDEGRPARAGTRRSDGPEAPLRPALRPGPIARSSGTRRGRAHGRRVPGLGDPHGPRR